MWRDALYAMRMARRSPTFSAVVVTTFAVAIGAAVAVFSIVDAWLLKELAFPHADRIVIALGATRERPAEPAVFLPFRSYVAWKARSHSFTTVSAAFRRSYMVGGTTEPTTALGMAVTGEFFSVLGVSAALGRTLTAASGNGPPPVVIGHALWQWQFGASPSVVGTHVALNGRPHEIVGVMPPDFDVRLLDQARGYEFWTVFRPDEPGYIPGGLGPIAIFGRLRDGVTIAAAQAELAAIHQDVEQGYTENFTKFVVHLTTLQRDNTRTVRATLIAVAGAVTGLLLIACLNAGMLLTGRSLSRAREAAIRTAIGCSRRRLVQQFLIESLLLSAVGGAAGLALAFIATRGFAAWNPLDILPATPIRIDLRAFAVAVGLVGGATLVSGLLPALRAGAADPADALRSGGRTSTGASTQRTQLTLLGAQFAASIALLVATTLFVRTFVRLEREPLGFDADNLTIATIVLPVDEFDSGAKRARVVGQISDAAGAIAGVQRVAAGTSPPLSSGPPVTVRTSADASSAPLRISAQDVTTDFFATLGAPILAGRDFDARDSAASPAVVVVNESAARLMFQTPALALGRRIRIGAASWREIVGVVRNTRSAFYNTLAWVTNPVIYFPASQAFEEIRDPTAGSFGIHLHIRAERPIPMAEVRAAVASVSGRVAVTEVTTASHAVAAATKQPSFRMALLGWFAFVSLALAAVGVYGLVAQSVAQRVRDIGIHLALGAGHTRIVWAVTRGTLAAAALGVACGSIAAFLITKTMSHLLYGIVAADAWAFATAGISLFTVTATAAAIPAIRATRIDPAVTLRAE